MIFVIVPGAGSLLYSRLGKRIRGEQPSMLPDAAFPLIPAESRQIKIVFVINLAV
jgi:hypothetical protein